MKEGWANYPPCSDAAPLASGDRIQISGLGTFEVRDRAARVATNPRTREKVQVPASKAVGFRAASALRGRVGSKAD